MRSQRGDRFGTSGKWFVSIVTHKSVMLFSVSVQWVITHQAYQNHVPDVFCVASHRSHRYPGGLLALPGDTCDEAEELGQEPGSWDAEGELQDQITSAGRDSAWARRGQASRSDGQGLRLVLLSSQLGSVCGTPGCKTGFQQMFKHRTPRPCPNIPRPTRPVAVAQKHVPKWHLAW